MSEKLIDQIVDNDKEWRRHLLNEISELKKEQKEMIVTITTLKVKIGFIASFFGLVGGSLIHFFTKKSGG